MKKFLVLLVFLLVSCVSSIPIISETDVTRAQMQWSGVTREQLCSDRELYILKCSGCHSLHIPNQYSTGKWNSILPVMNIKSKLSIAEGERIKRYLSLFSMTIVK